MVCDACGKDITLVPNGKHYKWVTDESKSGSWHCGNDRNYPVRAHAPKEAK
jgi:hypothetical protein